MAFNEVTEALREYEAKVAEKGGAAVRRLRPGLTREDAQRIAAGYDVTLTEDALAVWMWHDGEGTLPYCPGNPDHQCNGSYGIFAESGFPPLSVAFQLTERMCALWDSFENSAPFPANVMYATDIADFNGGTAAMCLWDVTFTVYNTDLPQVVIDCHDPEVKDSTALTCEYQYVNRGNLTVSDFIHKEIERLDDGTYTVSGNGTLVFA